MLYAIYAIYAIYGIYGNMDPINITLMLAYITAPWILWDMGGGEGVDKQAPIRV